MGIRILYGLFFLGFFVNLLNVIRYIIAYLLTISLHQFHHLVHILFGFIVTFLLEEHPSIGIKIVTIVWFQFVGQTAHLLSPLKVFLLERKIVGVVVKHMRVVPLINQTGVVCLKSHIVLSKLMVNITQKSI